MKHFLLLFLILNTFGASAQYIQVLPKSVKVTPKSQYQKEAMISDGMNTSYFETVVIKSLEESGVEIKFTFEEEVDISRILFKSNFIGAGIKSFTIKDVESSGSFSGGNKIHKLQQTNVIQQFDIDLVKTSSFTLEILDAYKLNLKILINEIVLFNKLSDEFSLSQSILQNVKSSKKLFKKALKSGHQPSLLAFDNGQNVFGKILEQGNIELIELINEYKSYKRAIGINLKSKGSGNESLLSYYNRNLHKKSSAIVESDFKDLFRQLVDPDKFNLSMKTTVLEFFSEAEKNQPQTDHQNIYDSFQKNLLEFFEIELDKRSNSDPIKSLLDYSLCLKESYDITNQRVSVQRFAKLSYASLADEHITSYGGSENIFVKRAGILFSYLTPAKQASIINKVNTAVRIKMTEAQPNSKSIILYKRLKPVKVFLNNLDQIELRNFLDRSESILNELKTYTSQQVHEAKKLLKLDNIKAKYPHNEDLKKLLQAFTNREEELAQEWAVEKKRRALVLDKRRIAKLYELENSKRSFALKNGYIYKNFFFWYTLGGYDNQLLASRIFHGRFTQIKKRDPNLNRPELRILFNALIVELSSALSANQKTGFKRFDFKNQVLTSKTETYFGLMWAGTKRNYRTDHKTVYASPRISTIYDEKTGYTANNGYTSAYGKAGQKTNSSNIFQAMGDLRSGNTGAYSAVAGMNSGALSMAKGIVSYFGVGSKGLYQFTENLYRLMLNKPSLQEDKVPIKGSVTKIDNAKPDYTAFPHFFRLLEKYIYSDYLYKSSYRDPVVEYRDGDELEIYQDNVNWCICVNNKIVNYIPGERAKTIKSWDDVDELLDEILEEGVNHPLAKFHNEYNRCKN